MIPLLAALGSMAIGGAAATGGGAALGGALGAGGLLGEMGASALGVSEGVMEGVGLTELNQASGGKVGKGRKGDQAFVDNVLNANPPPQPMAPVQSRVKYGQQPWEDYAAPNLGMGRGY